MMGFATNSVFTPSFLVDNLLHPRLECMQEDQLPNILIFQWDHSLHAIKVLDIGEQQAPILPWGEFQELHPISKHQVVRYELPVQPQFKIPPSERFE